MWAEVVDRYLKEIHVDRCGWGPLSGEQAEVSMTHNDLDLKGT